MPRAIIEFTTGQPGSGKSYRRCAWYILKVVLNPDEPTCKKIVSNYPVEFEPWVDGHGVQQPGLLKMAADKYGLDEWEVREAVRVFPPEVVDSWYRSDPKAEAVGPWDYFTDEKLSVDGVHIAIDEIHNFCPRGDHKSQTAWNNWLGEIRHEGATIEFLTQHPSKVGPAISKHAGIRRQLVTSAGRRDFVFNIPLEDWYNLGTVFGMPYRPSVWEVEQREVLGKWKTTDETPFWFDPDLFGCYNTSSASHATGRSGAGGEVRPYQVKTKFALIRWFVWRNGVRFFFNKTVGIAAFVLAIMFVGANLDTLLPMMTRAMRPSEREVEEQKKSDVTEEQKAMVSGFDDAKTRLQFLRLIAEQNKRMDSVIEFAEQFDGTDAVVALMRDEVIYASGQRARVGDRVDTVDGDFKIIERIDYEDRVVVYSDGRRGWIANDYRMLKRASDIATKVSELREYLRAGRTEEWDRGYVPGLPSGRNGWGDNDFDGVDVDR